MVFVAMQDTMKYSTYKLHAKSMPCFALPLHMKQKTCDLPKNNFKTIFLSFKKTHMLKKPKQTNKKTHHQINKNNQQNPQNFIIVKFA